MVSRGVHWISTQRRIKFVKGATGASLVEVDDTKELGVDRWRQADFLGPSESDLVVAAGIAEHPTENVWESRFWWNQITLVLGGKLTIQDLDSGAIYRGGEGDLFYWGPGLRARIGGAFRHYFVKTPMPTKWATTAGGKRRLEMLNRDGGDVLPGTPPNEVRKGGHVAKPGDRPLWPHIKFIKGATSVTPVKVEVEDQPGFYNGTWMNISLVNPVDTNLVVNAGIAQTSNAYVKEHILRWNQMVLVLDGEMITEDLDSGEVYKAHKGDFFYWAPGLRHTVGGQFRVLAVTTPIPRRWVMTPEGKKKINTFQLGNEISFPGSPPDEVQTV